MKNIVITGTSRGIGLELTRVALEDGSQVFAVARAPSKSKGLIGLKAKHGKNLNLIDLDIATSEAPTLLLKNLSNVTEIDILINNAGVLDQQVTEDAMMRSYRINSVAPLLVTQALLPMLKKSSVPIAAHITSKMGSIGDNNSGGYYAYRSSKAALNMINKSLSVDHPWLKTIVIHPGWVQTDMGGQAAPVTPAKSAEGIWQVIQTSSPSSSGKFYDYLGEPIAW